MQYHARLQVWCLGNLVPERRQGCHDRLLVLYQNICVFIYVITHYVSNETPVHILHFTGFSSNRWVLFSIYMKVVDSVSYTTGSCKMMFPISCMFTNNNRAQLGWRI